jgi:hypothetical protein
MALMNMFSALFKNHFQWMLEFLQNTNNHEANVVLLDILQKVMMYMAVFTDINDDNIFRQSMEFWL